MKNPRRSSTSSRRNSEPSPPARLRFHSSLITPAREHLRSRHSALSFTLIELLVVMGIIGLMLAALIPAMTSLSKSTGRKGAVGNLLSMLEQARVLAITDHRNTYVAFAAAMGGSIPASIVEDYSYRACAVFADDPANPAVPLQITKWQKLPVGISFLSTTTPPPNPLDTSQPGTSLTSAANTTTQTFLFSPAGSNIVCPYVKYDPTGAVVQPIVQPPMRLIIFEGNVTAAGDVATAKDRDNEPVRDELQISKFTGRAKVATR